MKSTNINITKVDKTTPIISKKDKKNFKGKTSKDRSKSNFKNKRKRDTDKVKLPKLSPKLLVKEVRKCNLKSRIEFWTSNIKMVKTIFEPLSMNLESLVYEQYEKHVTNMLRNNGERVTISYLKEARNIIYKFIAGDPNIQKSQMRLTTDKIPVFLQGFIPKIRAFDQDTLRVLISLLNLGKLVRGVGKLDTSTIEKVNGANTEEAISDITINQFIKEFDLEFELDQWNIPIPIKVRSSNGPFGPGMTSIIEEAKLYTEEDIKTLQALGYKLNINDTDKIITYIQRLRKVETPPELLTCLSTVRSHLRKITVVEDKELKNRVIAIFDYWSQLILRPFHDILMSLIKEKFQGCDATFNQDSGIDKMNKLYPNDHNFYSFDLKSATDLLPVDLQVRLISAIFKDKELGELWRTILIQKPFYTINGDVYYGTGQPMGAYTSWAMLAITHHLIVFAAAKEARQMYNYKKYYTLLGDDIVIGHNSLATSYKSIVEKLKMEIQDTKSIISADSYEFAKRFWSKGKEYTPLPLGQLSHSKESYWTIVSFVEKIKTLGYKVFSLIPVVTSIVSLLFKGVRKRKYFLNKIIKYYYSMNPYKDGWIDDIETNFTRWINPKDFAFSCNAKTDFKVTLIIQLFTNMQMLEIRAMLIKVFKSVNKWIHKNESFKAYKMIHDEEHPLVDLIWETTQELQTIESSNATPGVDHHNEIYMMKLSLKDFIQYPKDLSKVFVSTKHQATMKIRANMNNKFEKAIKQLGELQLFKEEEPHFKELP